MLFMCVLAKAAPGGFPIDKRPVVDSIGKHMPLLAALQLETSQVRKYERKRLR